MAASCLGLNPTLITAAPEHLQACVPSVLGGCGEMGVSDTILSETWLWPSSLRGKEPTMGMVG